MLDSIQHQSEGVQILRKLVEGSLESPVLLVGPEGVGKKLSVKRAAQEVFCFDNAPEGCACSSCYALEQGTHPDFLVLEAGEKDIGVDLIRELISESRRYPDTSDYRYFVIDGADRMTEAAANSFLKTLEEPPALSRFFLLAENQDQVLPTIRSRCGLVRYSSLPTAFILSVVQQYESDPTKALVYARMGEGSVGRAVRYWGAGKLALRDKILQILHSTVRKDLAGAFSAVDAIEYDMPLALRLLNQLLHDVVVAPVDFGRVVHADRVDELRDLHSAFSLKKWSSLARGIVDLQRVPGIKQTLSFHVKTQLAEITL